MSVGSLKQVDLTHEVTDLNEVPYLNFGQEIQSKKNLIRYYQLVAALVESSKAEFAKGNLMPLKHSSYVNILVDDPDMDFYRPKFLTYPKSGEKVNRFGNDLDQLKLDIENEFINIIKRIRSDLGIDGAAKTISGESLGIGTKTEITVDPRDPAKFITSCATALKYVVEIKDQKVGDNTVRAFDIDLPYFR